MRSLRVRSRQAHGRIEIVGTRGEGAIEDRHVEAWVHDIEHMGDAVGTTRGLHRVLVACVECDARESCIAYPVRKLDGTCLVVVGTHPRLEEVSARGDEGRRGADTSRTNGQNAHHESPRPSSSG